MAFLERSPAVRIGIISDTHGSLDPRAYAALADCDHIIHAGDIGGPSVLCELETAPRAISRTRFWKACASSWATSRATCA